MADLKRKFDDDEADLKDVDSGAGSEEESDEEYPDETMEIPTKSRTLWLVKFPPALVEKWTKVDTPGVELAVMTMIPGQDSKMTLTLPENPAYDTEGVTKDYVVSITIPKVDNQYAFSDNVKRLENGEPAPKKARTTGLFGKIAHIADTASPFNDEYTGIIRDRIKKANEPKRTIQFIDGLDGQSVKGGQTLKQVTSGNDRRGTIFELGKKNDGKKEEFNRFARMSEVELKDALFGLFATKEFWSAKDLRARTEQPEVFLKEILSKIAVQVKGGPNNHMWEVRPEYKQLGPGPSTIKGETGDVKREAGASGQNRETNMMKVDDDEEDEEDDDDDDGFEEVQ